MKEVTENGERRLLLYQQFPFFPSRMPSSDEYVTLQTDFSSTHSLVPAIHSHLKS